MPVTLRRWLILAALSFATVPLIVWFGGQLLAGPYEGASGLTGMLGAVYGDALRGRAGALLLLFAPVLLAALWIAAFRLRAMLTAGKAQAAQGQ